ncbi:uncharacterized protein LOC143911841 [Arctopsyche grandis]|uniref:uncharacterized protein LOC143911841 n=1 Tax=Arctopsyche grandis TaxID=121162 RepID=UPI00406D683B
MKMDKNIDNSGEDSPPHFNGVNNSRQSVTDALNEILDIFTNRLTNGSQNVNNGHSEISLNHNSSPPSNHQVADTQQGTQVTFRSVPDVGVVDGIDPSSPLGRSLQVKFSELEEISRRLKTRLNQVVCDQEILLSPDGDADVNASDLDLEWDLNTDSQAEDLTPQEFLQLVQSQMASTSQHSIDSSEKADDISK